VRAPVNTKGKRMAKTYNSRYSLMVTHLATNSPVKCLSIEKSRGTALITQPSQRKEEQ